MSEWVLPVDRQLAYHSAIDQLQREQRWEPIRPFVQGGFWRNYKVRYGEANEAYARMMYVSDLLRRAELAPGDLGALDRARQHLYRGQCNCAYWHGAFGGLYLPHLRNAIYRELIEAENQLELVAGRSAPWVEASVDDYNLDARSEVRLASDRLVCWLEPAAGGRLYELDVRSIGLNLGATLCRRPEAYHEKVRAGESHDEAGATSIHDRVVFKQANLEQLLIYDRRMRKSLIDHFWEPGVTLEQVARQQDRELADFADGAYHARIRRDPDRAQVQLTRRGKCGEHSIQVTKGVTLVAGGDELEIAYLIEGLPRQPLWFGVEFNLAGLPGGQEDRFFRGMGNSRLGPLHSELDLRDQRQLDLCDQWLGLDVGLVWDRPTMVWAFPISTVSQSESGFEAVQQSVAVIPHWEICGDARGRWSTVMRLKLETAPAAAPPKSTPALSSAGTIS
jgi:alpha-amylase